MTPLGIRLRALAPTLQPTHLAELGRSLRFTRADGLMVCTMLIWSINITSVKVVVGAMPPLGFGVLRYGSATAVLFAILWHRERAIVIRRADLAWVAAAGVVGLGVNQIGFLLGIRLVHASLAAILLATSPLITAAFAALWAGESLQRRTVLSLTVSFAGVIAVILGAGAQFQASWLGGLLILGSAATLAVSAVCAKRPLRTYSSLRVTAWMALFGCLTLIPFGLPSLIAAPWSSLTPSLAGATIFTVLGATVLGNIAWNYAVQQLGAARTSTYTYLQPVLGVLTAIVLLGERMTAAQFAGGVIVLLGLLLYPRQRRPTSAVVAPSLDAEPQPA